MSFFDNTSLTHITVKRYNTIIADWISYLPPHFNNIICLVMFPDISLHALHTHLKSNTPSNRHNYIVPVLSFIGHNKHILSPFSYEHVETIRLRWSDILTTNDAPITQRRLENAPTDNQLAKGGVYLKFNDFITARDKLPLGSIDRLLIAMYTMIPPVRADYYATQFVRGNEIPTEQNFIRILDDNTMISIINDFKTKKTYKQLKNDLPPELIIEIKASLDKFPRSYLFTNSKGKPYTRNSFTVWAGRHLSTLFGTKFTLVFFRHAFSTNFITINDMSKITDAQIKEMSDKMGNSPEMFKAYRWVKDGNTGEIPLALEESDEKE